MEDDGKKVCHLNYASFSSSFPLRVCEMPDLWKHWPCN